MWKSRGTSWAPGQILGSSDTRWFSHCFVRLRQRQRADNGVQIRMDFYRKLISKPPVFVAFIFFPFLLSNVLILMVYFRRRRRRQFCPANAEKVWESSPRKRFQKQLNVADAIQSVHIQQATLLQTAGQWMSDTHLAPCFGKRQISLSQINAGQRTSLARNT